MTIGSCFSGIGGELVAATMMGWQVKFFCEKNPFGRQVLEYWYPNAQSYEDITTADFSKWQGKIDVLTGGFPCQPFSYAGRRLGAEDDRYLWPAMYAAIDAIRPTWVVAENVGGILTMVEQGEVSGVETQGALFGEEDVVRRYELRETFTLERICRDLETHGYAVQPVLIPACAVGAPHRRDRVFIVGRRRDDERNGDTAERKANDTANAESAGGRCLCEHPRSEQPNGTTERMPSDTDRPCSLDAAAHAVGGGEGTPGEGGSVEGDGSDQDKQPCQRGAATEWNSRFYELLRNAADTDGDRGAEVHQHLQSEQPNGAEPFSDGWQWDAADTTEQYCERMRLEQPENCREEQEQFGRRGSEDGGVAGCGRWQSFPTVSPVHRGNDGLPFDVDSLTLPWVRWRPKDADRKRGNFSKWRTEALKAYGNAIVPQVMYEIFRAIEIAEKHPDLTSTEIKVNFDRNES